MKILAFLFTLLLFFSCSGKPRNAQSDIWKNTQKVTLLGENTSLQIPKTFKRSSRYRIESDIPSLKKGSTQLLLLQNALESMEFQDAEIDVFYDTTANYRILILINTKRTSFTKQSGDFLNATINSSHAVMEHKYAFLNIYKEDANIKSNGKLQMMKFKHRFDNELTGESSTKSVIFMTTPSQSVVAIEVNNGEGDIEDYLWSLKEA